MSSIGGRHTEFFGPDLGRGPFSSQRIETSALQIATALAQVRAPLSRSDDDLRSHATFIREVADRLAPDYATYLNLGLGPELGDSITMTIRTGVPGHSLLECWLADAVGAGLTVASPATVTFTTGQVIQTIVDRKHYRIITSSNGVATVTVNYTAARDWYWGVSRLGAVTYSARMRFV